MPYRHRRPDPARYRQADPWPDPAVDGRGGGVRRRLPAGTPRRGPALGRHEGRSSPGGPRPRSLRRSPPGHRGTSRLAVPARERRSLRGRRHTGLRGVGTGEVSFRGRSTRAGPRERPAMDPSHGLASGTDRAVGYRWYVADPIPYSPARWLPASSPGKTTRPRPAFARPFSGIRSILGRERPRDERTRPPTAVADDSLAVLEAVTPREGEEANPAERRPIFQRRQRWD